MEKTNIYFDEKTEVFDICLDGVFKAVFTRDTPVSKGALSKLISHLIGREITIITISVNELPIDNIRDRQIRFDIHCRAETGERINVEMSLNPAPFELIRMEFHAGKLFIAQDIKGADKNYDGLKQAYQITILGNGRFFQDEEFFHSLEYYDPIRKVSLNGRTRIITLELSKLKKIVDKPEDEMSFQEHWAVYFKYLTDKSKREKINKIIELNEGVAMASEALLTITEDDKALFRKLSEEKRQLDIQSWESWEAAAELKGREEGRQEGMQKGLEKGREEGQDYVLELVAQGLTYEEIKKKLEENKQNNKT